MNETPTLTTIDAIVDGYFAMWNETDAAARRAITAATWTPDGAYLDPMFAATGYDELAAIVTAFHQQFPGYRFRLTGAIDAHHDRARWGWECFDPNGASPSVTGVDFAMLAPDGRLRTITGFFAQPGTAA